MATLADILAGNVADDDGLDDTSAHMVGGLAGVHAIDRLLGRNGTGRGDARSIAKESPISFFAHNPESAMKSSPLWTRLLDKEKRVVLAEALAEARANPGNDHSREPPISVGNILKRAGQSSGATRGSSYALGGITLIRRTLEELVRSGRVALDVDSVSSVRDPRVMHVDAADGLRLLATNQDVQGVYGGWWACLTQNHTEMSLEESSDRNRLNQLLSVPHADHEFFDVTAEQSSHPAGLNSHTKFHVTEHQYVTVMSRVIECLSLLAPTNASTKGGGSATEAIRSVARNDFASDSKGRPVMSYETFFLPLFAISCTMYTRKRGSWIDDDAVHHHLQFLRELFLHVFPLPPADDLTLPPRHRSPTRNASPWRKTVKPQHHVRAMRPQGFTNDGSMKRHQFPQRSVIIKLSEAQGGAEVSNGAGLLQPLDSPPAYFGEDGNEEEERQRRAQEVNATLHAEPTQKRALEVQKFLPPSGVDLPDTRRQARLPQKNKRTADNKHSGLRRDLDPRSLDQFPELNLAAGESATPQSLVRTEHVGSTGSKGVGGKRFYWNLPQPKAPTLMEAESGVLRVSGDHVVGGPVMEGASEPRAATPQTLMPSSVMCGTSSAMRRNPKRKIKSYLEKQADEKVRLDQENAQSTVTGNALPPQNSPLRGTGVRAASSMASLPQTQIASRNLEEMGAEYCTSHTPTPEQEEARKQILVTNWVRRLEEQSETTHVAMTILQEGSGQSIGPVTRLVRATLEFQDLIPAQGSRNDKNLATTSHWELQLRKGSNKSAMIRNTQQMFESLYDLVHDEMDDRRMLASAQGSRASTPSGVLTGSRPEHDKDVFVGRVRNIALRGFLREVFPESSSRVRPHLEDQSHTPSSKGVLRVGKSIADIESQRKASTPPGGPKQAAKPVSRTQGVTKSLSKKKKKE